MAQCLSPWQKDGMDLPCGKCTNCKARRVSAWSYRLMKEAEVSSSAFFITLTYAESPRTENNLKTVRKEDLQKWMKRLRKTNTNKLKYYAAAEYGSKTKRPHYHIILFNADINTIHKSWQLGHIHIGQLTEASTAYTLKYISKGKTVPIHPRDDREPEFSLMSKGLGKNYLTPQMKKWHKKNLKERMYVPLKDGKKIAMPRYYKDKIYSKLQRDYINEHIRNEVKKQELLETCGKTKEEKDKYFKNKDTYLYHVATKKSRTDNESI